MSAKHFVNDPTSLVSAALQSLAIANPSVAIDAENKVVYRRRKINDPANVSIVSGGGSGHEPSFGGFVGAGLLSASVAGTIFASPSSTQILAAIENLVDTREGILVTVMNYTGDVLNFGVAVEKARAKNPSVEIEMLVVGDDVGVPRTKAGKVGRRGIAGTVLVHKITGALAAEAYSLQDVARVGRLAAQNIISVGVSLARVHVPGRTVEDDGVKSGQLEMGEVELGMGIHNEPGSGRKKGQEAELSALVKEMLRQMLSQDDEERSFLNVTSNQVVLLVNNLGALSVLELGAITTEIVAQLDKGYTIRPVRVYSGTYMTSLNGLGFSISILQVVDTHIDLDMVQLLDAPSEALGWSAVVKAESWKRDAFPEQKNGVPVAHSDTTADTNLECDISTLVSRLTAALKAVIAAEPDVTRYDTIVGDGDCGTTLSRGAEAILAVLQARPALGIVSLLSAVTSAVESTMDGTSGALYSIFLNSLTQSLRSQSTTATTLSIEIWIQALQFASTTLARYTPAKVGDRTLVDALHPFIETLASTGDVTNAAREAEKGAEKTKMMKASLGRAVYVGGEEHWVGKVPDPGAWGLSRFFQGLTGRE